VEDNLEEKEFEREMTERRFSKEMTGKTEGRLGDLNVHMLLFVQQ
jgi:hypothetical protein